MTFGKKKMEQDDLEEDILIHSMAGQIQLIVGVMQSNPFIQKMYLLVCRLETLLLALSLVTLLLSVARLDKHGKVLGWCQSIVNSVNFIPFLYTSGTSSIEDKEWSEVNSVSSIFSMQGRRPNNEDRAVSRRVVRLDKEENSIDDVHIFAVLDGHGGDFSADYAAKHLIDDLTSSIQKLKILTCNKNKIEKLKLLQKHFEETPKDVLKYLKISKTDQESIALGVQPENLNSNAKEKSVSENESREVSKDNEETENGNDQENNVTLSRDSVVLSSRSKPLEELPTLNSGSKSSPPKTPKFVPKVKHQRMPRSLIRKSDKDKKDAASDIDDKIKITDYISENGDIIYPKLIKDHVIHCDKHLLVEAKKANSIGGTTLILAILDEGQLWVGNVGDSRGVFCNDIGMAIPMSYDHKPCQLKEKKRIQEAGGFVAMNGVWRVQGVLATSRALGDYPLKDKKVVVADPDVLSFSLKDHRMEFAVLASDGLWDTHSNDEATAVIRTHLRDRDGLMGASVLSKEAWSKGSLDNITILVINLLTNKER